MATQPNQSPRRGGGRQRQGQRGGGQQTPPAAAPAPGQTPPAAAPGQQQPQAAPPANPPAAANQPAPGQVQGARQNRPPLTPPPPPANPPAAQRAAADGGPSPWFVGMTILVGLIALIMVLMVLLSSTGGIPVRVKGGGEVPVQPVPVAPVPAPVPTPTTIPTSPFVPTTGPDGEPPILGVVEHHFVGGFGDIFSGASSKKGRVTAIVTDPNGVNLRIMGRAGVSKHFPRGSQLEFTSYLGDNPNSVQARAWPFDPRGKSGKPLYVYVDDSVVVGGMIKINTTSSSGR